MNQIPWLQDFREHAARFAHQLDDSMGHHSLQSAELADRMTIYYTLRDMLGSAELRYKVWELVDPQELIHGGNYDGTPLWARTLDENQEIDRAICGQCDIATFARRALFNANIPLLRRLNRSGIVYSLDMTVTPWGARIFDVATQPESSFYDELIAQYHDLLVYYDTVVGPG